MGNTTYFNILVYFALKNTSFCQHIDIVLQKHPYILCFLRFTNRCWARFGQIIDTKTYLVFRFEESAAAQTYGKPAF